MQHCQLYLLSAPKTAGQSTECLMTNHLTQFGVKTVARSFVISYSHCNLSERGKEHKEYVHRSFLLIFRCRVEKANSKYLSNTQLKWLTVNAYRRVHTKLAYLTRIGDLRKLLGLQHIEKYCLRKFPKPNILQ